VGDLRLGAANIRIGDNTSGASYIYATQNAEVTLYHNNSPKLATTSTGVDITGTLTSDGLTSETSDGIPLTLNGGANASFVQFTGGTSDDFRFGTVNSKGTLSVTNSTDDRYILDIGNSGDISFYEDTGTTPKFFWDASAENLGIGTSSIQSNVKMQIVGEDGSSGASANVAANELFVDNNGNAGVTVGTSNTGVGYYAFADSDVALRGGIFYNHTDDAMGFRVLSEEAMRIDSSGNVGIGVVPEAWSSLYGTKALQVGAQASLSDINGDLHLSSNAYYDTTNARWEYINADYATKYTQVDGVHQWLTAASGSADAAITWSEAMRIDSSGNLLVGATSSNYGAVGSQIGTGGNNYMTRSGAQPLLLNRLTSDGDIVAFYKDSAPVGSIKSRAGLVSTIILDPRTAGAGFTGAGDGVSNRHIVGTDENGSEVDGGVILGKAGVRFKDLYLSGSVFAGATSGGAKVVAEAIATGTTYSASWPATGGTALYMQVNSSAVGSITTTTSATAYNTSSDYRLKTDAQPMTGATDRLKQLNPVNFEWIADGTRVDGFLAHEAQAVVPEAVTGAKDAMRDEEYEVTPAVLDDDGNVVTEAVMGTRSVPDYQGIDQSKLVPLLVATIKELEARITALEAN
jgi:hypothetical protein